MLARRPHVYGPPWVFIFPATMLVTMLIHQALCRCQPIYVIAFVAVLQWGLYRVCVRQHYDAAFFLNCFEQTCLVFCHVCFVNRDFH